MAAVNLKPYDWKPLTATQLSSKFAQDSQRGMAFATTERKQNILRAGDTGRLLDTWQDNDKAFWVCLGTEEASGTIVFSSKCSLQDKESKVASHSAAVF